MKTYGSLPLRSSTSSASRHSRPVTRAYGPTPFVCASCRTYSSSSPMSGQRRDLGRFKLVISRPRNFQSRHFSPSALGYSARSSTNHGHASWPPPKSQDPDDTRRVKYVAHLKNRALIRLAGRDALHFLHNLLPAPVLAENAKDRRLFYTALLNAKGRIQHDVFLYRLPSSSTTAEPQTAPTETRTATSSDESSWLIDVDGNSAATLFSTLKKHKLRSKFRLERLPPEKAKVYYIWPGQNEGSNENDRELELQIEKQSTGSRDPRPGMGWRVYDLDESASAGRSEHKLARILAEKTTKATSTTHTIEESGEWKVLDWDDYLVHRILNGHAEGPVELVSGQALPQESNIDFSGGIDFHKGCYLGQELTIRTHHTGVVRKRILPVQISSTPSPPSSDDQPPSLSNQAEPSYDPVLTLPQPPHEANISKHNPVSSVKSASTVSGRPARNRSTGKWLAGYGNIGLALCRLEAMTDLQLTNEPGQYNPENDEFRVTWESNATDREDNAGDDGRARNTSEVRVKAFVPSWLRRGITESIQARTERGNRKRRELIQQEEETEAEAEEEDMEYEEGEADEDVVRKGDQGK